MQNVALLIAVSVSTVILFLSPVYALIAYIGALVLCPYYLTTQLSTLNFPVHRIVILALYANLFLRTSLPGKFKFLLPDKLLLTLFVCQCLAGATTSPDFMQFLENRAGRFFDMALPYFAVRLIVTDKQRYVLLLKGVLCMAAVLSVPAFYHALTGHNLLAFGVGQSSAGGGAERSLRLGFFRASGTFGNSIQFGIFFAMAGGICAGLLKSVRKHIWLYWIGIGLTLLGVFSSMSSGSWLAAAATIAFFAFYRYRRYWKQAVVTLVVMCGLIQVISNRHFWEVIDRVALNSQTAWYRSRLIEVALFEGGMADHWLTGYGFTDPGWGTRIAGRSYTDMVNHYLLILCRYGLVGFIPFCWMIIAVVKKVFEGFWLLTCDRSRWLVWCLAGVLFGVLVTFNSVSIFPPCRNFFYIVLGLCGALSTILYNRTISTTNLSPS